MSTRKAAILGGNRIPFARSNGPYSHASNQDMLTATIDGLVARFGLQGERLGEVVAGAVLKHSRDFNLTREAVLGSRLSAYTPAYDLQQACGTGLETAIVVANKIALGQIEVGIAGGVDTTSDAPIAVNEDLRQVLLASTGPRRSGPGSRHSRESGRSSWRRPSRPTPSRAPACRWASTRPSPPRNGASAAQAQDELAAASHHHLAAAYDRGFFDDLLTPYLGLSRDQNLRPDSTRGQARQARAGVRQGRGSHHDRRATPPR